jgi:hypothetical protein
MNDTGAALAGVASDMGAGQAQMLAQQAGKEPSPLNLRCDWITVHGQGYNGHGCDKLQCMDGIPEGVPDNTTGNPD